MAGEQKPEEQALFPKGKYPYGKIIVSIVVGILIGIIFGYLNDSSSLGVTCGFIITISIIFFVLLPDGTVVAVKSSKKLIFVLAYFVLIGGALVLYLYSFNSEQFTPHPSGRELPVQIEKNFKNWTMLSSLLRLVHIILGLVATVCSILVAMEIKKIDNERKKWLAFTAAISYSILSAFDLGDKANRTRTAWREMNAAIIRYQEGVDTSKANLIMKYEEAEKIIGDVKPSPKDNVNITVPPSEHKKQESPEKDTKEEIKGNKKTNDTLNK
jgi:hypothetical protein